MGYPTELDAELAARKQIKNISRSRSSDWPSHRILDSGILLRRGQFQHPAFSATSGSSLPDRLCK